jgi:hypothetical protein
MLNVSEPAQIDSSLTLILMPGRNRAATMIVRCIDNLLQVDVLDVGSEYEVRADRDDCYILSGFDKGFSKKRFEIVSRPTIEFSGHIAAV